MGCLGSMLRRFLYVFKPNSSPFYSFVLDEIQVIPEDINSHEEVLDESLHTQERDEIEVLDESTGESSGRPAPTKKRKASRSYGAALLDFNEVFMEKYQESNREFLEGQAKLQKDQQEFEKKMAEEERTFFRSLFESNG